MKRDVTAELRRDMPSEKWPDRFSRSEACSAKPESFRNTPVGVMGKFVDTGDGAVVGDGGDALDDWLFLLVELVEGLSP